MPGKQNLDVMSTFYGRKYGRLDVIQNPVYERKLLLTHHEFFSHVATTVPEIQEVTNIVIVTDSETAIRKSCCTATSG